MNEIIDILVIEHIRFPMEIGWVEYKHNNCEPTMIGEGICPPVDIATITIVSMLI